VKAGDETLTIVQCSQRIDATLKMNVQMQIGSLSHVALEQGKRDIVARMDGEELMAFISGIREYACEVGPQSFDVRLHARAGAALRPQQSFGKLRRARGLALRPEYEGLAERLFPLS
jgi:hypothetical protein